METTRENFKERREIFMSSFKGNHLLTQIIPETTAQVFYDEFGISIDVDGKYDVIPIVFTEGWKESLKYIGSQQASETTVDVCGVIVEYVTDLSESDKPMNIEPQMFHNKTPILGKKDHTITTGSTFNDEMDAKFKNWRTSNLTTIIESVEGKVRATALKDYGIDLMIDSIVYPLMASTYRVGLDLARTTKEPVNMYNIFTITVVDDDSIIITPSSFVKQYLKDDGKH